MHIVGPALTTTSYKKRKQKITKAKLAELEQGWRDRNVRLKEMGLPKDTFEQYMDWVHGHLKEKKTRTIPRSVYTPSTATKEQLPAGMENEYQDDISQTGSVVDKHPSKWRDMAGACSSKPSPTYTGTKMIGIATMHKSNMVPVFSDTEAEEISRMRR